MKTNKKIENENKGMKEGEVKVSNSENSCSYSNSKKLSWQKREIKLDYITSLPLNLLNELS